MPRFITLLVCVLLAAIGETSSQTPEYLRKYELNSPYFDQLSKHLFVTAGDFGRMVWESSFQDDVMVVSVYSVSPAKGNDKKPTFRITVTRPNKRLMDFPDAASNKKLVIWRHDAEIDADLAFTIQRTWRMILAKDPIPDSDSQTVDGFGAIFSVVMPDGETIVRNTANPERPPATDLVSLGVDLSLYYTVPIGEQKSKREEIMRRLQKLIDTYGKP